MKSLKLLLGLGLITCLFGCKTKSNKNDFKFDGKSQSEGEVGFSEKAAEAAGCAQSNNEPGKRSCSCFLLNDSR